MKKVEEIIEIGIKAHFAAGFGDLKYVSKEIAQALSSAGLVNDDEQDFELGECVVKALQKDYSAFDEFCKNVKILFDDGKPYIIRRSSGLLREEVDLEKIEKIIEKEKWQFSKDVFEKKGIEVTGITISKRVAKSLKSAIESGEVFK